MTKLESPSELQIELHAPASGKNVPGYACEPGSFVLSGPDQERAIDGQRVLLRLSRAGNAGDDTQAARVFAIRGQVTLGQDAERAGVEAILLSGRVSMHAEARPSVASLLRHIADRKSNYVAETVELERGDSVQPAPVDEGAPKTKDNPTDARGFIRVPADGALQVGYFFATNRVVMHRAGNALIELDLSIWNRISNEPALSGGLTLLLLLFAAMDTVPKLWANIAIGLGRS